MKFSLSLKTFQLRVFSSLFTDLSAGWFLSAFATTGVVRLIVSSVLGIFALLVSFYLERVLDDYDKP